MPSRLLLFCALLLSAGPALAMTIYKHTDAYGVVSYSDRPMPGARPFVFRDQMVEQLDSQVHLQATPHAGGVHFSVYYELYAHVEVELRLDKVVKGNTFAKSRHTDGQVPQAGLDERGEWTQRTPGRGLKH